MKGVILAAGKGTRMLPLTLRRPKPLVPLLDRPLIEHIITGARDAGVDHIALVIGYLGDQMVECFGDGAPLGVRLEYIRQEEAGGTGQAALLAEDFVGGDDFFMSWGDIIVPPHNYRKVVDAFEPGMTDAVLSLNEVDDPCEGAAVYVLDGFVERIVEKPPRGTSTTNFNNAGLFVWRADIFERLRRLRPSARGELELPDAVQEMIREGRRTRAVELDGYWSDVARPATVLALNETMLLHRHGDNFGVFIHPEASVSQDTVIKPPVFVGPGCVVEGAKLGSNAVLMERNEVGPGAHIVEAALFTGARVGGRTRVRHCLIEEGAWVGEGEELTGEPGHPLVVTADGQTDKTPT